MNLDSNLSNQESIESRFTETSPRLLTRTQLPSRLLKHHPSASAALSTSRMSACSSGGKKLSRTQTFFPPLTPVHQSESVCEQLNPAAGSARRGSRFWAPGFTELQLDPCDPCLSSPTLTPSWGVSVLKSPLRCHLGSPHFLGARALHQHAVHGSYPPQWHAHVHTQLKQSCGTQLPCDAFPPPLLSPISLFLELCLLWDVSDCAHYYYGMPRRGVPMVTAVAKGGGGGVYE